MREIGLFPTIPRLEDKYAILTRILFEIFFQNYSIDYQYLDKSLEIFKIFYWKKTCAERNLLYLCRPKQREKDVKKQFGIVLWKLEASISPRR